LRINQLHDEVRLRRERALARWAEIGAARPALGRALDLQRRLIGSQLDLLATIGPEVAALEPPSEARVLDLLADGFPVLRGGIGPMPVDLLGPAMADLARDIAAVSGYHAASRVADALSAGTLDIAALLAHVYQRDQDAVGQMAADQHLVVDLLWLVGDLVAAPVVHVQQLMALRDVVPDSPVREALERWDQGYCPACGSWPALAQFFLGERLLRCAFCAATWRTLADRCAFCGERGAAYRTVVPDTEQVGRRLELCRACGGFLKTLDASTLVPFPLVAIEDLASSDLDQTALHHGFRRMELPKLRPRT
jgi:Protein involved in formate dehydrogenase formation